MLDKEGADKRENIFMIDASKGYIKDGNKNKLREQDIHKIVDTFNNRTSLPKYSRTVSLSEISDKKNDYNLSLSRYIDSQEIDDIQNIEAHLLGGIPQKDIDELNAYWEVYPKMKSDLYKPITDRPDFFQLNIKNENIKSEIYHHPEFMEFSSKMSNVFSNWKNSTAVYSKKLDKGLRPKHEIFTISESLLKLYSDKALTDKYSMYQHQMDYWASTMQDDLYELAADGWIAGKDIKRIEKKTKKGDKEIIKIIPGIDGLEGRIIPPSLIINRFFKQESDFINKLEDEIESIKLKIEEIIDENSSEDSLLVDVVDEKGKITKASISKRLKEIVPKKSKLEIENKEEFELIDMYRSLLDEESENQVKLKEAKIELEKLVINKYSLLTIDEIKIIVVEDKWLSEIEHRVNNEMDNISYRLTQRIVELADRYETPMPKLKNDVIDLMEKVENHLKEMDYKW
jgi:type I restriction enzyme M protein